MGERAKWVLVVDDDEDVCTATVDMLEGAGYLALAAPGGVAALRMIAAGAPSLVLSDLTMGGMDGQKLLKCTRELLGTATPPFVFLTGLEPSDASISPSGFFSSRTKWTSFFASSNNTVEAKYRRMQVSDGP